ncbi:transcription factor Adf-1-like [Danio aesculapii]|uniref:transcription factor Adf-1-like n=1 Tax=Danio aesculapii TaxID=1142201 RepID=UPI0024BF81B8|nr:transcription factor Adf-1-like [Danio aesculapii]
MAAMEKLIQTVYAFPVLYNVSLHDYRSTERRVKAWREVAASVGLPVVECKRRWKTIRDRYIRERRLCKLKKDLGGRRLHYWPHRESLAFLDAHIRKRRRPSGAQGAQGPEEEEHSSAALQEDKEECVQDECVPDSSRFVSPLNPLPLSIVTQLKPVPQVSPLLLTSLPPALKVAPASTSAPPLLPASASAGPLNGPLEEQQRADGALDEDQLFLLSYVPALKRLTPQKRAAVKMQIQQIMFNAEFKEP